MVNHVKKFTINNISTKLNKINIKISLSHQKPFPHLSMLSHYQFKKRFVKILPNGKIQGGFARMITSLVDFSFIKSLVADRYSSFGPPPCLDRNTARTTFDYSRLQSAFSDVSSHATTTCQLSLELPTCPRFRKPPFSSRTVGFPEYGWRPWHLPKQPSLYNRGLSAYSHTPLTKPVYCKPRDVNFVFLIFRHCVLVRFPLITAMCREPLCTNWALPTLPHCLATCQEILVSFHSSYRLMRLTKFLLHPSTFA